MLPNNLQTQNSLTTIVGFIAGFMAAKFTFFDQATWLAILMAVGGAIAVVYNAIINRNIGVAKAAAAIPGTTVVTTPEIAAATPAQANIVSHDEVMVSKP